MKTWTVICPNEGVYAGEGHFTKKAHGFLLHLKKVVKIKDPLGESCDANPHAQSSCKIKSVQRRRESCVTQVKKKCSKGECDPYAVCRATNPCQN